MSWRIRISHRSGYRYTSDVWASYNEARMTPLQTTRQFVVETELDVEPRTPTNRYLDYWGTVVHAFDVHEPHHALRVTSHARVETAPPTDFPDVPGWNHIHTPEVVDRCWEFLAPSRYVIANDDLKAAAEQARQDDVFATACSVIDIVRDRMAYTPGATTVDTSAPSAWALRQGVCQDFAHATLAIGRSLGIPSRYVSGYLHPDADAELGATVVGQSHAWVEMWLGGWRAFDPTNGDPVSERHVVVGRGRDYDDVPPLKGIYQGGVSDALGVEVLLTREA